MTKNSYSAVLLFFFCFIFKAHAEEPASVYIYLFKSGKPLPQIEISTDDGQRMESDTDGYAVLKILIKLRGRRSLVAADQDRIYRMHW